MLCTCIKPVIGASFAVEQRDCQGSVVVRVTPKLDLRLVRRVYRRRYPTRKERSMSEEDKQVNKSGKLSSVRSAPSRSVHT